MEAVSRPLQYGGCCPCSKRSGDRFHFGWGCFVGFVAVALFAFSARAEWKYYAKDETGNPTNVACITDGSWILQVNGLSLDSGTITIGLNNNYDTKILAGSGVLDLRGLKVTYNSTVCDKIKLNGFAFYNCKTLTEFYADNLTDIAYGHNFWKTSSLKHIELGGTFASLGLWEFYECPVTNLVVNSKNFKSFSKIFNFNGAALKTLTITTTNAVSYTPGDGRTDAVTNLTVNGPAWTQTALDNLLAKHSGADGSTAATAAKPCTIYVDKSMGWDGTGDYAQDWSPSALTAAEKAVKPKKCFGVYVTKAGARKAWLANTANSKGLLLIVR